MSRKRGHSEMETAQPAQQTSSDQTEDLRQRLRNCVEFAALMQYIFLFGKVIKIDEDFGIDDLEAECLKPEPSDRLLDIGLAMLKFVSSHRGLTHENFDEYTRRQYNAKAPHKPNPFGYDEEPKRFRDFDIFQKLRVLHQLSIWTFRNPDRIRERMPEQREIDQTQWRIEELGYDRHDRLYYVLDDNRLYRRTDPPIPPPPRPKPKANSRRARAAARAAKRRKLEAAQRGEEEEENTHATEEEKPEPSPQEYKWECIAVTLQEYKDFVATLEKTKDPNEKILRDRLVKDVLPVIEQVEEEQQKKRQKQEKELLTMQLLATAKRSSRIADRMERERREREEREAALKREEELAAALREQERQKKLEAERRHRIMTREQRIREREHRRILQEAEMARLQEEQRKLEAGESRASERHLKAEMARRKKEMESLAEETWIFDCSGCGVHGENLDDGTHSVACERCNVWQHSKCLGIEKEEAEKEDFHFVCKDCKQREEDAKKPKIPPLKLRIGPPASPSNKQQVESKQGEPSQAQQSPSTRPQDGAPPVSNGLAPAKPPLLPAGHHPPTNGSFLPPASPSKPPAPPAAPVSSTPSFPSQPATHFQPPPEGTRVTATALQNSAALQNAMAHPGHVSRPSSSHSAYGPAAASPMQNPPSMSPTQGNRDVGPLAGFPMPTPSGSVPTTRHGHHYNQMVQPQQPGLPPFQPGLERRSSLSSMQGSSFSHTPPPAPPQPGMPFSGLSPTKNSPPRPVTGGSTPSGAPVVPPVQRLEPSPKLVMGQGSPDAPLPPPVKTMPTNQAPPPPPPKGWDTSPSGREGTRSQGPPPPPQHEQGSGVRS
ncbi:hypothetical protein VTN31DRAFT_5882 [Thermomyces dupontii]|uniref:uncharacterized protein n=1 Tax=Talaromyces thermophilus TaxID=28565 RepID=UPI003743F9F7